MKYLEEIEEVVFEPAFGYGYEPDARKRKKKKGAAVEANFTGMKKPLANPVIPLLVSLLFALLLLVCVLASSIFSQSAGTGARLPGALTVVSCDLSSRGLNTHDV